MTLFLHAHHIPDERDLIQGAMRVTWRSMMSYDQYYTAVVITLMNSS